MNRILAIVVLSFVASSLSGQAPDPAVLVNPKSVFQNNVPLSPDVANIDRYVMTPPNLSNGLPQQNIPLFDIKENGVEFSEAMFYNYSGFRVKEDATCVGLGWGLTDAMIVREVKHIPDDHLSLMKKFEDYPDFNEETGIGNVDNGYWYNGNYTDGVDHDMHNYTRNRLFYKYYDAQPDVFVYNFAGYSGKFLWLNGKAIKLDYNDLIIDGSSSSPYLFFSITTPAGTKYTFTAMDNTAVTPAEIVHPPVCNVSGPQLESYIDYAYTTAWRLTEIKSNITQQRITLSYRLNGYVQEKTVDQITSATFVAQIQYNGEYEITGFKQEDSYTNTISNTYIPDVIESDHYKAVFVPNTRLDGSESRIERIDVFNKQNLALPIKSIEFEHDYFGDISSPINCWLKLKKVSINGMGMANDYVMSYVNEYSPCAGKSSLSIDHWGYYNAEENGSLIPLTTDIQNLITQHANFSSSAIGPWADRTPDFSKSSLFALEKIQYPTKGYTKFVYESSSGKGIRVQEEEDNDGLKSNFKYYDYGTPVTYPAIYSPVYYSTFNNCGDKFPNTAPGDPDFHPDLPVSSQVYIYGSTPDGSSNFIPASTPFYSHVTENIGTVDGQGGRTTYDFIQLSAIGGEVILTSKKEYAFSNSLPVAQENYTYSTPFTRNISYWLIPKIVSLILPSSPCYENGAGGKTSCTPTDVDKNYMLQNFAGGAAQTYAYWKRLDEVETVQQGVSSIKRYYYAEQDPVTGIPLRTMPERIEQTLSNGKTKKTYLFYPGDIDPDDQNARLGIPEMWDPTNNNFANWTGEVAEQQIFVDGNKIQQTLNHYSRDNANSIIVQSASETLPAGETNGKISYSYQYDPKGNLLSVQRQNAGASSLVYGYGQHIVTAEVVNASPDNIAYTSFEDADYGHWLGVDPSKVSVDTHLSITGSKNYNLSGSTLSFNTNANQTYTVSYWSNNGSISVNGSSYIQGRTTVINGESWTYFEHLISGVNQISIAGNAVIDELRLYPKMARMSTFIYNDIQQLVAKSDPNSRMQYFQYDNAGRLAIVRDHDYNIVKRYCYAFYGQSESCNVPSQTATVEGYNTTRQPWTLTISNSSFTGSYEVYPGTSGLSDLATVPAGVYAVTLSPVNPSSVTAPISVTLNGVSSSGTNFSFTNVSIVGAFTVSLQQQNTSSSTCNFTLLSGYTSPTNTIGHDANSATFTLVLISSTDMAPAGTFHIATVDSGCRPSSTRTIACQAGGRNWNIIIYSNGEVYLQLDGGATSVPANQSVLFNTLTYQL